MGNNIFLMDTCSYYRIAANLLSLFEYEIEFQGSSYIVKIHSDVQNEFNNSLRLKSKYCSLSLPNLNRKNTKRCPPKKKIQYLKAIDIVDYTSDLLDFHPPPSMVDKRCLSLQYIYSDCIITVTDDKNMRILADNLPLPLKTISSVELLIILYDNEIINQGEIKRIRKLLIKINDWHYNFDVLLREKHLII